MLNHYYYLSPPYQRPTNHHTPNNPQPLKQETLTTKTKSLEEYLFFEAPKIGGYLLSHYTQYHRRC